MFFREIKNYYQISQPHVKVFHFHWLQKHLTLPLFHVKPVTKNIYLLKKKFLICKRNKTNIFSVKLKNHNTLTTSSCLLATAK